MNEKRKMDITETENNKSQCITCDSSDHIFTFVCDFDSCESEYDKYLPPKENWWSNATFLPNDYAHVVTMCEEEKLIWRSINGLRHVLVSGIAGSGKSYLLKKFIEHSNGSINTELTAPTGIAAMNIGGKTLHKALGLGLAQETPDILFKNLKQKKRLYQKTWNFLLKTQILVIDEISMLNCTFFHTLDYLFRKAREVEDKPFGGLLLIMFGDFCQLGPVISEKNNQTNKFVFESEVWKEMKISRICLKRNYRQTKGDPLIKILSEIRAGQLSDESYKLLLTRINTDVSISSKKNNEHSDLDSDLEPLVIEPVDIFPYRNQVDKKNNERIKALVNQGHQLHKFLPYLRIAKRDHVNKMDDAEHSECIKLLDYFDKKENRKNLEERFPFFQIEITEGSQVMCRTNSYFCKGICNGTLGIVKSIDKQYIDVCFVVNGEIQSEPTRVERQDFFSPFGTSINIVMRQFPITTCYAVTVHKTQGLTLDSARVSASNCFESGQLYTSLSRVRALKNLSLMDFDIESIIVDEVALEFENF
jgi:hypothetical protein